MTDKHFDDERLKSPAPERCPRALKCQDETTERMKMKRFYKNWPMHNIVAHPLMQILEWIGLVSMADKLHDATLPPNAIYPAKPAE